jgi:hypothetical protein
MARSHLMLLLLLVGALLAHPVPSGDTALSASSSELSQDAVSFLQEEGEDDAVLADGESGGNGKKVLKKKIKALEKRTDARRRRMANQHAKKKIKKKIKATEKVTDAKERKDHAAEKKAEQEEGDDGAVSFLQYEAATPAVLQPHEVSVLFKKLLSKSSDKEEEGEDDGEDDDPDVCDKEVQKGFFDMIDTDHSGEVSKEELIDFAKGMCEEDEGETEEDCEQEAEHVYDMLDTNGDGEVSLDEFETFLDNMFGCNGKARTNLKAHTGGNGKKKLKKKLKAMEKKAEARRKQTTNQHAKKVVKKKIKASEKVAEAKERAHAAAARKAEKQQEDGDDDGKAM